jgi:hypothetical protein
MRPLRLDRFALHPPQHASQPRANFSQVERLGNVVVGTDLEPDDAVDHFVGAGDHDDPDLVALAQEAREREAVLVGETNVEQHHRGRRPLHLGAHRLAAVGQRHLVAVRGQVLGQQITDLGVVVDDQDAYRVDRLTVQ